MDLKFTELKCPVCKSNMESGNTTIGTDVQLVKRCCSCSFYMVILIPNKLYEYTITKKLKQNET